MPEGTAGTCLSSGLCLAPPLPVRPFQDLEGCKPKAPSSQRATLSLRHAAALAGGPPPWQDLGAQAGVAPRAPSGKGPEHQVQGLRRAAKVGQQGARSPQPGAATTVPAGSSGVQGGEHRARALGPPCSPGLSHAAEPSVVGLQLTTPSPPAPITSKTPPGDTWMDIQDSGLLKSSLREA